jgi:hypothetical protein
MLFFIKVSNYLLKGFYNHYFTEYYIDEEAVCVKLLHSSMLHIFGKSNLPVPN